MDEFGSEDLSGTRDLDVLINADLPELIAKHAQRLAAWGFEPRAFSPVNLLQQYEELNRLRIEKLIALGLAKSIEPTGNVWRFTLKGAWANATQAYLKGLKRAEAQSHRKDKKRPGS